MFVNYLNFVFHIEVETKSEYKILNFVFHIEVETKSEYKILNFVFQFIKNHEMTL